MKKKWIYAVLLMFLINIISPALAYTYPAKPVRETSKNGRIFISGELGEIKGSNDVPLFLKGIGKSLKKPDKDLLFKVKKVKKDDLNMSHFRVEQYYKGIPVYGKEIIVHTDSSGQVRAVNGSMVGDDISIDTTPQISPEKAVEITKTALNIGEDKSSRQKPSVSRVSKNIKEEARLVVYDFNDQAQLAYVVEIGRRDPKPLAWKVFVDAHTGEIINKIDRIVKLSNATGYGYGYFGDQRALKLIKDENIYFLIGKTNSTVDLTNNVIWTYDYEAWQNYEPDSFPDGDGVYNTAYQAVGVDAHYNANVVYNYFKQKFGRNSWDGMGAPVYIGTYYSDDPVNAFWDPFYEEFIFGPGNGTTYAPFSSGLDVVAHEFTHAITDHESGLEYYGQSGALNESFSDVFACLIDPDWQLGEDILMPGVTRDADRDVSNPEAYGQPAHMDNYVYTTLDYGGVHTNSGIPNKAFYNIASGIGRDAAAKIYYRALTQYITMESDFYDAKNALLMAARDLYGLKSQQYNAVAFGWGEVGITNRYELSLSGSSFNLVQGNPQDIEAIVKWDDSTTTEAVTDSAVWTSSNTSVVTVNQGQLTPVGKGAATITAEYDGLQASAAVTVTPAVNQLLSDKSAVNLTVGGSTVKVNLTAIYSDGTRASVTTKASWSSADSSVAGVSAGVVKGLVKGETKITAVFSNKSLDIPVKVTPALTGLVLDKPVLNMTTGDVVPLDTTAWYSDGSSETVTGYCLWSTSNARVAIVSDDGEVTAVGKGRAAVTAKFGNKSAKVKVEVTPPVGRIEADKAIVAAVIGGSKVKMKVTAYYIDGSKADVSKTAIWETEDNSIASVLAGSVTGLARGETNITVSYKDKFLPIPVIVTPKVLRLSADKPSLDLTTGDEPASVYIRAYYNDGSDEDVTTKASWKSSKTSVVTVNGGQITPVAKGTATISAQFNGKKVNIKTIVTPPVVSLVIDKNEVNMLTGSSGRLKLTANYVDGSYAIITNNPSVTWDSSNPDIATVKGGLLRAVNNGEAVITAYYKGQSVTCAVRVN